MDGRWPSSADGTLRLRKNNAGPGDGRPKDNEEENDGKNEITNTARAHNVKESCAGWRGSFRGEGFEAESDLRTRPGAVKGCGEKAHRRQNETTKR